MTPYEAVTALACLWLNQDRSGIGIPYGVAFYKWLNGDESWEWEKEREIVRSVFAEMQQKAGEVVEFGGDKFILWLKWCADTRMYIVCGARITAIDDAVYMSYYKQRARNSLLCYKDLTYLEPYDEIYSTGPSNYDGAAYPLREYDYAIFEKCKESLVPA